MYLKGEIDFIEYLKSNDIQIDGRFMNDPNPQNALQRVRGQIIYFLRLFLVLVAIQFLARSYYTILAINSKTLTILEFDKSGNPVHTQVPNPDTWVCYKTFKLLEKYYFVINF